MSSRCKNCGGILEYDIASGKVICQHCDSRFEPKDYEVKTAAEEYKDLSQYETTMFVCPSCGAEISSTEFDVVDYCLYCGSFVSLESRLTQVKRPTSIIPFSKTKEDCKQVYRNSLRYKLYAPSEFRDEKFLDGFKGIYIPFWNYQYKCGPKILIRGEEEGDRDGSYVNVQEYDIKADFSAEIDNNAYDASSSFDDEISLRIAPFTKEKQKPFNTSYMFGFYGDIADIGEEVYKEESDEDIKEKLWKSAIADKAAKDGHPVDKMPETLAKDFHLKGSTSLTMLPVWFLTWRKGDRLAYSVVNGETGKLYAEIPVSITRYFLFSLLTAIPIFFALNFNMTFSASEMLGMSMFLGLVMIMTYVVQLDNIVRRVMHTDDRGFLETHEDAKAANEEVTDNLITAFFSALYEGIKEFGWYTPLLLLVVVVNIELVAVIFLIIVVATPIYTFYRLYGNAKLLKDNTVWLDVAASMFSIVLGAIMLIADPAPDYFYYYSALLCLLGVAIAAIRIVKRYNQLLTRPVPHFFRKEAKA